MIVAIRLNIDFASHNLNTVLYTGVQEELQLSNSAQQWNVKYIHLKVHYVTIT